MIRSILLSYIVAINISVFSLPANAASLGEKIVHQGNGKGALACMTCHGEKGQGNASAGYPHLAGLPVAYIQKQLHDFAKNTRQSPVMQPFAKSLSDNEIRAVAKYYSALPPPAHAGKKGNPRGKGEQLAKNGKWEAGVPACFQCHGNKGQGVPPHFPPVRGQPESYIKQQLTHWKNGQRSNDPLGLMQTVVTHLDSDDIAAVASYLASLSPAPAK